MSKRTVQTLILLVDNEFGVLTRITGNIRREGWNIRSLVVAETLDAAVSRLTISVECIDSSLPQVLDRLGKLNCVRSLSLYSPATHFALELVLVTLGSGAGEAALKAAEGLGARAVEGSGRGCPTLEFTGTYEQAESLLDTLRPYGVANVARSGLIALERPARGEGEA